MKENKHGKSWLCMHFNGIRHTWRLHVRKMSNKKKKMKKNNNILKSRKRNSQRNKAHKQQQLVTSNSTATTFRTCHIWENNVNRIKNKIKLTNKIFANEKKNWVGENNNNNNKNPAILTKSLTFNRDTHTHNNINVGRKIA